MPDTDLVKLVQDAIDKGARSVEEVHLSIAAMPLELLRQVGPLEGAADTAEDLLHSSIGAVYDTILAVNRQVGDIAETLLGGKDRPSA